MEPLFKELDYRDTPLGTLVLRKRRILSLELDVVEVKLGDEHLMSSIFTESETALGHMGIERSLRANHGQRRRRGADGAVDGCLRGEADAGLDVVVGGLGLGYTAAAVLSHPQVSSLVVVELFDAVVEWHRRGLLPLGTTISDDPRCRFVVEDFFRLAAGDDGFDPQEPGRLFDAILLDIDHSPEMVLDPGNAGFYQRTGLQALSRYLRPGGTFGLWSNDPPDTAFRARLEDVFEGVAGHPVTFQNPLQGNSYTQTVYLAQRGALRNAADEGHRT